MLIEQGASLILFTWYVVRVILDTASILIEHGASITETDAPGDTPLHFTCVKGFLDTALKTLCTKMIDFDKIDGPKHTRV